MAITTINNRAINRADTAASGESWTATSATASDFQAVGGDNTPAFKATMSAGQSIGSDTSVKLQYNSEVFDTDGAFDSSTNYRFTVPSGKAGKYFISASVRTGSIDDQKKIYIWIAKNGATSFDIPEFFTNGSSGGGEQFSVLVSTTMSLSVGDYIEAYTLHQSSGSVSYSNSNGIGTYFTGFKLIE